MAALRSKLSAELLPIDKECLLNVLRERWLSIAPLWPARAKNNQLC